MADVTGHESRVLYGCSVNLGDCVALAAKPHVAGVFIGRPAWAPDGFLGIVGQDFAA